MKKIVLIHPIPTHYRLPLFNELAKRLKENNTHLRIFFCRLKSLIRKNWRINMKEANFAYRELNNLSIYFGRRVFDIPYSLLVILFQENPQLIICTGFSISSIVAYVYCKLKKIPYIIWSGAYNYIHKKTVDYNRHTNPIRRKVRSLLVRQSAACIAYSSVTKDYFCELIGIDSQKIFIAMNTVDTRFFVKTSKELRTKISEIKRKYSLARNNIVYVGDIRKRKGVYYLLESIIELRKKLSDFCLHMVGDGHERKKLEDFCIKHNIDKNVYFWGYKPQDEVAHIYTISDFFIFPTLVDPWGLVLSEAMASGLPVIASKYAGATHDLVQNGVNGFVIDPENIKEMAQKILILLKNEKLRKKMGENAKKTIQERFTIEKSAQGFIDAIEYALNQKSM
ncbi:MAG: glycosyltransferase family 4 protein [Candidatus Hodarchaeota archaeon]